MQEAEAERAFLYEQIPLASHTGLRVLSMSGRRVRMRAPLSGNHNDKRTAFSGALMSVGALAGWVLAKCVLRDALARSSQPAGDPLAQYDLVIGTCNSAFRRAIVDDFVCEACIDADDAAALAAATERFAHDAQHAGKGKLGVRVRIAHAADVRDGDERIADEHVCASIDGVYAALRKRQPAAL